MYRHGEFAPPRGRDGISATTNTDESAIHKCNYTVLEVKVQSFCVVKLMKSTLRYTYEVLVWTHAGASFLISHQGYSGQRSKPLPGTLCEKSEFRELRFVCDAFAAPFTLPKIYLKEDEKHVL